MAFLLACALLFSAASACLPREKQAPKELDLSGTSITVWDVSQPAVAGAPDYSAETARVVAEFEKDHGVKVDLRLVSRQDISLLLAGKSPGTGVSLVYSTEWPFVPAGLPGSPGLADPAAYVDSAAAYWTKDGAMLAAPAYVHWVSAVSTAAPDKTTPATACIPGSAAFLKSALDYPSGGWDPDNVVTYLAWVKETYGTPPQDPLAAWQDGAVQTLFPVTPYLYQWLRDSGGRPVTLSPEAGPRNEPGVYYTVPGYLVLAGEEPYRTCAAKLAVVLAANLGRWAARAIGGLPAAMADAAVFQVDSRFSDAERSALIQAVYAGTLRVPAAADFLYAEAIEDTVSEDVSQFLSGKTTEAELSQSIREASQKHTKP